MKTLLLVRHAKSSWADAGLSDFDRPLNDRGRRDAPEMAKRLVERKFKPDLLVSSPARRAYRTAKFFAEELEMQKKEIVLIDALYLATQEAFQESVKNLDDSKNSAAIFSHNPGITEFASSLTTTRIDEMPTCAIFAVQADTNSWSDFFDSHRSFLFFDFPKNGQPD